jgi:hypothetical protein
MVRQLENHGLDDAREQYEGDNFHKKLRQGVTCFPLALGALEGAIVQHLFAVLNFEKGF